MTPLKLLAGLGNPGEEYARTRHNVGFRVIDTLAERHAIRLAQRKFKSRMGEGALRSGNQQARVVLLKPLTFMNLSGSALQAAAHFFKLRPEDIVVIYDDLDLPFGKIRIRERGGDGGHRGVRSILDALGEDAFIRLRVGIGRPVVPMDPIDYVLQPFTKEELDGIPAVLDRAADALETIVFERPIVAMNRFND
jgi:PTH1 family peptidyl-tRNA hydrolase